MKKKVKDFSTIEKVEEEVNKSSAIIKNIFEAFAFIDLGNTNLIQYVNLAWKNLLGYTSEEVVNKKEAMLVSVARKDPRLYHKLELAIKQKKKFSSEMEWKRKDGRPIIVDVHCFPIFEKGKPVTWFNIVRDITEKKKSQEKIRESEEKYRRLFETAQDAILILNGQTGKIEDSNPFIQNLLKYSPNELIGKQIWQISPFKNIAANKGKFAKLRKKKYVRYEDLPLETKDGKKIYVEFVSNVYSVNKKEIVQCNIRDITERHEAKEREKYQALFDNATDALFIADPKTRRLTDCNKNAEKLIGYSKDKILSMKADDLHPKDKVKKTMEAFKKQFKGKLKTFTTEVLTKNKKRIPVSITTSKVNLNGKKYMMGIFRDISEQKKAEEELKESEKKIKDQIEKLKELDTAKTDFLNTVSHELKTPLTAMYANLELLEEVKKMLPENNVNNLEALRRNSNQLRFLIDNILEIARIQSNKLELNISEVDLGDCIKNVEDDLRILSNQKNIKLFINISSQIRISTDNISLTEVLRNLIDNSIKFTEKGYVEVKASKKGTSVLVEVKDTGIGIPESTKSKIFEKFYQISTPLKSEVGGTGLGLSICKELVELLGGKIGFRSQQGKGSTFYFTLPIKYKKEVKK